jgi:hypothetical protein
MAKQAHEIARAHLEVVCEDSHVRVRDGDTERSEITKRKRSRFDLTAAKNGKAVRNREILRLIGNRKYRVEVGRKNLVIPAVATYLGE